MCQRYCIEHYKITQPPQQPVFPSSLLFFSDRCWLPEPCPSPPDGDPDISLLYRLISRTMLKNAVSTFVCSLAEVSINLQPKFFAKFRPSAECRKCLVSAIIFKKIRHSSASRLRPSKHVPSKDTCRSPSRSHLLPTRIIGK